MTLSLYSCYAVYLKFTINCLNWALQHHVLCCSIKRHAYTELTFRLQINQNVLPDCAPAVVYVYLRSSATKTDLASNNTVLLHVVSSYFVLVQ